MGRAGACYTGSLFLTCKHSHSPLTPTQTLLISYNFIYPILGLGTGGVGDGVAESVLSTNSVLENVLFPVMSDVHSQKEKQQQCHMAGHPSNMECTYQLLLGSLSLNGLRDWWWTQGHSPGPLFLLLQSSRASQVHVLPSVTQGTSKSPREAANTHT